MDSPVQNQESEFAPQKRSFLLSRLQNFEGTLPLIQHSANRLTGLVTLTEDERDDAGIYLGDQNHDSQYPIE